MSVLKLHNRDPLCTANVQLTIIQEISGINTSVVDQHECTMSGEKCIKILIYGAFC